MLCKPERQAHNMVYDDSQSVRGNATPTMLLTTARLVDTKKVFIYTIFLIDKD